MKNLRRLKNTERKQRFVNSTRENVKIADGQRDWVSIKEGLLKAVDTVLKREKLITRKPWITQQILDLIKKRNNCAGQEEIINNVKKQKALKQQNVEKLKKYVERRFANDIKKMICKGKMSRAYDRIKSILFQHKTKSSIVKNKVSELLIDTEDIRVKSCIYRKIYHKKNKK